MKTMTRCSVILGVVLLSAVSGCGGKKAEEKTLSTVAYRPSDYSGVVDKSLSPAVRAKQIALAAVFDPLLEGATLDGITKTSPDIHFNESSEKFYEGASRLVRWKFNGAPKGDAVPVVLTFATTADAGENERNQRKDERVYLVSGPPEGAAKPFTIVRK
jgi:hypothetical protein